MVQALTCLLFGCLVACGSPSDPASTAVGEELGAPQAQSDACALLAVVPAGLEISAPFDAGEGGVGTALPRGALVQAAGRCPDGKRDVQLVAAPRWYVPAVDIPPVGTRGCLSDELLGPPGQRFLVQADSSSLHAGDVVALDGVCDAWTVHGAPLDPVALSMLRPVTTQMVADAARVKIAYEAHFGPLELADVPMTDQGFVGLPLPEVLDDAALAAAYTREHLDTPERQGKGLRAYGGHIAGRPAYAHFFDKDKPWSDIWGTPNTIVQVLDLAANWAERCPAVVHDPARCLLQLGDLAWFKDQLPDPLGHKDHHAGTCVDVRLFRTDASRYESSWRDPDDRPGVSGGYSRALTTAFLRWATTQHPVTTALFGDPVARTAVPFVRRASGHDDHIHLCF